MGWQGLSKGLIIGIIVGLVLGFGGGYYYRNLNASGPAINQSTSNTNDLATQLVTAQLNSQLRQSIKDAVKEHGFKTVFGTGIERTTTAPNELLQKLGITAVANAQEKGCAQHRIDFVLRLLQKNARDSFEEDQGPDNHCLKSVSLKGTLSFKVYQGVGDHGEIDWNAVEYTFDVTYKYTRTNPDNDCTDETETRTVRNTDTLYWDGRNFHDDPPEGVRWELLCEDSVRINWTFTNPYYNKKKCCEDPNPTPIGGSGSKSR